jgi:hypothetical protein
MKTFLLRRKKSLPFSGTTFHRQAVFLPEKETKLGEEHRNTQKYCGSYCVLTKDLRQFHEAGQIEQPVAKDF